MLKVLKKTYRRTQNRRKRVCKVFDRGNCFLSESEDKRRRKRLSYFILGLAGLLVVVPSLFLLKHRIEVSVFPVSQQEMQYNQQATTLSLMIYRHYVGYDEYCTKQGVPLNVYPAKFMERFQKEVDFLHGYLKGQRGTELGPNFSKLRYKFARVIDKTIVADFEKMKQTFQKEYQLPNPIITNKDVCLLLEEKATDLLKKGLIPDYAKIQKTSVDLINCTPTH